MGIEVRQVLTVGHTVTARTRTPMSVSLSAEGTPNLIASPRTRAMRLLDFLLTIRHL